MYEIAKRNFRLFGQQPAPSSRTRKGGLIYFTCMKYQPEFYSHLKEIRGYLYRNGDNPFTEDIKKAVVYYAKYRFGVDIKILNRLEVKEWLLKKHPYGSEIHLKKPADDVKPIFRDPFIKGTGAKDKKKKRKTDKRFSDVNRRKEYKDFLNTPYWKDTRDLVIERDENKCARCGSKEDLHVHHLTYVNHGKEMDHMDDLVTLCHSCHQEEHPGKRF